MTTISALAAHNCLHARGASPPGPSTLPCLFDAFNELGLHLNVLMAGSRPISASYLLEQLNAEGELARRARAAGTTERRPCIGWPSECAPFVDDAQAAADGFFSQLKIEPFDGAEESAK